MLLQEPRFGGITQIEYVLASCTTRSFSLQNMKSCLARNIEAKQSRCDARSPLLAHR